MYQVVMNGCAALLLALALLFSIGLTRKTVLNAVGQRVTGQDFPHSVLASVCWAGFWLFTR